MKDKRQRMALTWPYADPHFAAYMFAAAATAAYGNNYWSRGGNNAASNAATSPSSQPYPPSLAPYVMRAMGTSALGCNVPSSTSPPVFSPTVGPTDGITNIGSLDSLFCRGCPSSMLSASSSPPRIQPPSPTTSSVSSPVSTPTTFSPSSFSSKPLFQPYKNDVRK